MDEIMQLVFEVKENIPDGSYMKLVEKIAEVNPNKEMTVEYPYDTQGVNPVVSASPQEHINNLKRKYKSLVEKYNKDTTRYLKMIADLTEDNMKLRKEAEDWEDDDDEEDEWIPGPLILYHGFLTQTPLILQGGKFLSACDRPIKIFLV